ncbi:MAG: molybdenum cofactor guanylyltransferase [Eubacteriales bacterium]|nr:molybdenum cofactor guanylyltransferase [Eubacteriales bacterium]
MTGENFSMIVLAGGKSSRMGTDKADLTIGDKTFLQIQIEKGRKLGIRDIQVSGYRGTNCDIPVTPDRFPNKGPLGGLESCLRGARHEKCLVLSVDVPLVPVEELENLLHAGDPGGASAMILKNNGKEQPLIAVYHKDLADAMLAEITDGNGSVFAFLNKTGYAVYESAVPAECFLNVNAPEAYADVKKKICRFM